MKKLLLLASLLFTHHVMAEDIPGKTLLSYYSGSCKSSGQWTQTALADSQALIKTLDQMMKDTDCASSAGAISQLNALQSQLSTLSKLNDTKNSLVEIDAQERDF